ncbi:type 1 fimbrial protein [Pseudomonas fluorescens]|uniref:fimbrial protein n=1 Tax=Pseudomonas khavaziana TaxID=2842351 RepID=UPI0010C0866A|nr:fimbrial protein [Pseudomonas khavaziana]MBV4482193.1 type 1 fimbrial protein [Pseudomonas khavaziana]TKK14853.1 type 1 fimbrial protein [Pseudomonas fluorescens]
MAIQKRHILAAAITALITTSALAADGTINFTGEITAASCKASSGAGTSVGGAAGAQIIEVPMGKVSIDSLSTKNPGIVSGTAININLDCGNTAAGLTTVKVMFDPSSGSGVDGSNNNLLKTTGAAKGVGIGIFDSSNNLINLAGNGSFDAPLVKAGTDPAFTYTANLNMRASYVANGVSPIVPGPANGTLPFTLTYQ